MEQFAKSVGGVDGYTVQNAYMPNMKVDKSESFEQSVVKRFLMSEEQLGSYAPYTLNTLSDVRNLG
jgi:hypothetical protein